jgi:hypothetical protein
MPIIMQIISHFIMEPLLTFSKKSQASLDKFFTSLPMKRKETKKWKDYKS